MKLISAGVVFLVCVAASASGGRAQAPGEDQARAEAQKLRAALEEATRERQALRAQLEELRAQFRKAETQRKEAGGRKDREDASRGEDEEPKARPDAPREQPSQDTGKARLDAELRLALQELEAMRQRTQVEYRTQIEDLKLRQSYLESRMKMDMDQLDRRKATLLEQFRFARAENAGRAAGEDKLDRIVEYLERLDQRVEALEKRGPSAERKGSKDSR